MRLLSEGPTFSGEHDAPAQAPLGERSCYGSCLLTTRVAVVTQAQQCKCVGDTDHADAQMRRSDAGLQRGVVQCANRQRRAITERGQIHRCARGWARTCEACCIQGGMQHSIPMGGPARAGAREQAFVGQQAPRRKRIREARLPCRGSPAWFDRSQRRRHAPPSVLDGKVAQVGFLPPSEPRVPSLDSCEVNKRGLSMQIGHGSRILWTAPTIRLGRHRYLIFVNSACGKGTPVTHRYTALRSGHPAVTVASHLGGECSHDRSTTMDTPFVPSTIETSTPQPGVIEVPLELDIEELQRHMVVTRRKVRAGQYLYRNGQPFHALYLVHAGFLKTCELSEDGREQVTGFRMRGDLLGAESIGLAVHTCDAVALEDSQIWELPYPPVLTACLHIPELQIQIGRAHV